MYTATDPPSASQCTAKQSRQSEKMSAQNHLHVPGAPLHGSAEKQKAQNKRTHPACIRGQLRALDLGLIFFYNGAAVPRATTGDILINGIMTAAPFGTTTPCVLITSLTKTLLRPQDKHGRAPRTGPRCFRFGEDRILFSVFFFPFINLLLVVVFIEVIINYFFSRLSFRLLSSFLCPFTP